MKHLLDTQGRPLPGDDPDGRRRHDRRRRRLDRLRRRRRHLPRRPALGGRRPGPGRLRPRRHRAHRDRRDGQPRLAAARGLPRRRHDAATPSSRARRSSRARPQALGMSRRGGVDGRRSRSSRTRWCSRSRRTRCARASTRATSRSSPRAAPARCSRRRSRSRSARRGCSCRRTPAYRGDGAARHRHGLRVRRHGLPAAVDARQSTAAARASSELEEQARAAARGGRHPGRPACSSSASPTAATSARATSCASTSPRARSTTPGSRKVRADFHDAHEREYSRRFEESDIEIPNIRVRGIGLMPELRDAGARARRTSRPSARSATRATRGSASTASCGRCATRYYDRAALLAGQPRRGPGDRQPVRLDDRRSRPACRRTSTASATS